MTMTYDSGTEPRRLARSKGKTELAERIEGHIVQKASGRIHDLDVVCCDDQIIVRGRSRTYHAKQLAQQAVLDLTGGHPALMNQIVVC